MLQDSEKIQFPRFPGFLGGVGKFLGNIFLEEIIIPGKNNFRQILEPDLVPRRNSFGGWRKIFSGTSAKPMIANGSLQRGRAHRKKNPGDGDILYGSLFRGSGWAAGGGFFTFYCRSFVTNYKNVCVCFYWVLRDMIFHRFVCIIL